MPWSILRAQPFQISYGPADDRLHDFYIPALSCSVRYDRTAGFFSSCALAVAAAGVARLIANRGTMRLLVGAQLSEADVHAIEQGQDLRSVVGERLVAALGQPEEELMRGRLQVLAWMLAAGTLQIKVVLPRGPAGRPLPASQSQDYFHPKEGLFTDSDGDQVAFSGSVNESAAGWQRNYERFMVYRSWDASQPYLVQVALLFERLWNDQEPDWIAMDIPAAAQQGLLKYCPRSAPTRDPLEREEKSSREEEQRVVTAQEQWQEQVLFQFLRDAPHLLNNRWLGAATSVVTPWPHQARIADTVVEEFPERFLLCDEVGLGKTIEAGLALRQLLLSGECRRCLILAPKSICRQWQEELYEKFALNVPVFDGQSFRDLFDQDCTPDAPNPWDAKDVFIASSQLAKRQERRAELLQACSWDLVLVDEAHHARRKDFLVNRYRPNRLLELLMGQDGLRGLKDRTQGMLLMTATPMQIHPVEVWDLLQVVGLGGRWGAGEENFLRFFHELRRPFDDADWDFVLDMVRDFLDTGGQFDPIFARHAEGKLGLVDWQRLRTLVDARDRETRLKSLPVAAQPIITEMARRHTPLRRYLFRSTRRLLREYAKRGILQATIPTRDPLPVWIRMRAEEQELYNRIDEYVSQFYQKYEHERKGLGFIMTVYRRRLTSSFYAVQESLKRRLDFLNGRGGLGLADEDVEQEDLSMDVGEQYGEEERSRYRDEIEYVEDFLAALQTLGGNDSKVERLLGDLKDIFREWKTVLVFTQYTDTMDFLRDQLRQVYGSQVACYSGRGGETWNGIAWVPAPKEEIKNAFLQGEEIKILLGTEALSEGLNLQTCGVLINYDMPWNPMRVEQRIGRIDRINQVHNKVRILHYFYEQTVEARVYQALEDRIGWFEDVVGELQPILARLGQAIQTVALTPEERREQVLAEELAKLRAELDAQKAEGFDVEQYVIPDEPLPSRSSPLSLADLERLLLKAHALAGRFEPHPDFKGAYWLKAEAGRKAVTFDASLFDAHTDSLQLLTYGNPLLTALLQTVPEPAPEPAGQLLRCSTQGPPPVCAYYTLDSRGQPQRIERLADLETLLLGQKPGVRTANWSEEIVTAARVDFQQGLARRLEQRARAVSARHRADRVELEEQARQTLLQTALVELAMGQQPQLLKDEAWPMAFTEEAITGLRRHGYPFAPLLKLVRVDVLSPSPTDPFYVEVQDKSRASLEGQFRWLQDKAKRLLRHLADAQPMEEPTYNLPELVTTLL